MSLALAAPGPWTAPRTVALVDGLLGEEPTSLLGKLPPAPRFPPRPIEEILSMVVAGRGDEVSLMEWVFFLKTKCVHVLNGV